MTPFERIEKYWVYGGMLAALVLLALAPLLVQGWGLPLVVVYLALPVYMLHQFEEHDDDRFAKFINAEIGHGREVLSQGEIFWINICLVWVADVVALWLAAKSGIGWGLIPVAGILINATVHIVQGARMRRYNPGLATAIVLFLPFGVWAWSTLETTGQVDILQIVVALAVAILGHLLILAMAFARLRHPNSRST